MTETHPTPPVSPTSIKDPSGIDARRYRALVRVESRPRVTVTVLDEAGDPIKGSELVMNTDGLVTGGQNIVQVQHERLSSLDEVADGVAVAVRDASIEPLQAARALVGIGGEATPLVDHVIAVTKRHLDDQATALRRKAAEVEKAEKSEAAPAEDERPKGEKPAKQTRRPR